jgi:hypothetical protein
VNFGKPILPCTSRDLVSRPISASSASVIAIFCITSLAECCNASVWLVMLYPMRSGGDITAFRGHFAVARWITAAGR